jgi:hypothetical protein
MGTTAGEGIVSQFAATKGDTTQMGGDLGNGFDSQQTGTIGRQRWGHNEAPR